MLTYHEGRLTVTLGEVVLFDEVSIHAIPGKHRIGVATFGPEVGIERFDLDSPSTR